MYLQFKIAERSESLLIRPDKIDKLFSKYSIPKRLRNVILEEMKDLKLLRDNGIKVQVINCQVEDESSSITRLTRRRRFENIIINRLVDVIIHEELHKRFDEAEENHQVLNEQDEDIFKLIRDWVERDKLI